MRIGFDVRMMQTKGTSATRGIGRYTTDLLEGLLAFYPEDRLVLLAMAGRPVPHGWAERCEVVEVGGEALHEAERPWHLHKVPKVRSMPFFVDRWQEGVVAGHRRAFERAVNGAGLDVMYFSTALDVAVYPEGDLRPPVVATFLDAIPLVHREEYYDAWPPLLRRMYDRQLANLKVMAALIAISETSRQDAIRFAGLSPDRVRVVYPAVAPAFAAPVEAARKAEARSKLGLDAPYVLFCSAPDPHKNAPRVVAAFAKARKGLPTGAKLAFIAPSEFRPMLTEEAASVGLEPEALVVTGRITDEEVVALFQDALCLVSPSLIEGFGLPAAQALAAGTPAIATDHGSLAEVVGEAGLRVDPKDVDAIARAMVQATDAETRATLVARGHARAPLFSPEGQARGVRAIFEEVALATR